MVLRPVALIHLPDALGVDDSDLALGLRRQVRNVLLGVDVEPAYEDAVDRLEVLQRFTPPGPPPDGVAGHGVLVRRKNERDIDRDTRRGQFLQRGNTGGRRGNLDHAVLVAFAPVLS